MTYLSIFIALLLLIATAIVQVKKVNKSSNELKNNKKRITTWWVIFSICIPVFIIGDWAISLFCTALTFWGSYEVSKLLKFNISSVKLLLFTLLLLTYNSLIRQFPEFYFLYSSVPFLFLITALFISLKHPNLVEPKAYFIYLLVITSLFSLVNIWNYSENKNSDTGGILLFLFFITASNDIFQYISGKLFGCNKLTPVLSENKTREGALGGILLSSILSLITFPLIIDVSFLVAAITGLLISILGIGGDLYISYLKRQANVKDSGSSLPGHGGLLDRIDSLLLTAPGFSLILGVAL